MSIRDAKGASGSADPAASDPIPWQLRLFSKSLKKRQKLDLLLRQIEPLAGRRLLLVTCGDNNGSLNFRFREVRGTWTWAELEADSIPGIIELLAEPVLHASMKHIPVESASFDIVVAIDVHEHLPEPEAFNRELARIVAPGGYAVVTTPNGDPWKPVSLLRRAIGMTKEKYGHVVYGYNVRQHESMLAEVGLEVVASGSYSGFWTELLELGINFAYTTLMSRRRTGRQEGEIAPSTEDKLRAVEKQYRLYSAIYPVFRAISALDALTPFFTGYAVSVVARRPHGPRGAAGT